MACHIVTLNCSAWPFLGSGGRGAVDGACLEETQRHVLLVVGGLAVGIVASFMGNIGSSLSPGVSIVAHQAPSE